MTTGRAVIGFIAAYTIGFTIYGVATDSSLTFIYLWLTLLLFVVFGVFHRLTEFPPALLWVMAVVGLFNMVGGVVQTGGSPLYSAGFVGPVPYDKFFHAVAAFGLSFIAWHVLLRFAGDAYNLVGLLVINFLVVMGGGAVVEIGELIGTAISDVSVGDYGNNALDLVANATGAFAGCVVLYWRHPKNPVP